MIHFSISSLEIVHVHTVVCTCTLQQLTADQLNQGLKARAVRPNLKYLNYKIINIVYEVSLATSHKYLRSWNFPATVYTVLTVTKILMYLPFSF